jgi:glycosyltransferase involved in cell wall biosynthesis
MHHDKLRVLACCGFPSRQHPSHQPFVREMLAALAGQGAELTVIAPESLFGRGERPPRYEVFAGLPVHRPRFASFSEIPVPGLGSTGRLSDAAYRRAALRAAGGAGPADVCYGHFLYPHGVAAAAVAARRRVAARLSRGESSFRRYERTYRPREMSAAFARFRAIVANSPVLEAQLVERYGVPKERVTVLPNGVDEECFRPHDRAESRRRLGLPAERPILVFVGHWNERKGPLRVMEAIRARPDVGAVFLGRGFQRPEGPQVLHAGAVPHEDMPVWLSAADPFVLPTLDEGCSNALLEALACGLPVVTSDRPFNRAVVDESVGHLVEPRDPAAIGAAIAALVDRPAERAKLAAAALAHAQAFSLERRAARIHALLRDVAGA